MERTIKGKLESWEKLCRRINRLGWYVYCYDYYLKHFKIIYTRQCFLEIENKEK